MTPQWAMVEPSQDLYIATIRKHPSRLMISFHTWPTLCVGAPPHTVCSVLWFPCVWLLPQQSIWVRRRHQGHSDAVPKVLWGGGPFTWYSNALPTSAPTETILNGPFFTHNSPQMSFIWTSLKHTRFSSLIYGLFNDAATSLAYTEMNNGTVRK
jgi:hypothetical protein